MVRHIALKQASIGLRAMLVQLKGEMACHGAPQRRVNPLAVRQAERLARRRAAGSRSIELVRLPTGKRNS